MVYAVYHHFASVRDVTHKLVAHLKPRGTLVVADILRMEAVLEIHTVRVVWCN